MIVKINRNQLYIINSNFFSRDLNNYIFFLESFPMLIFTRWSGYYNGILKHYNFVLFAFQFRFW